MMDATIVLTIVLMAVTTYLTRILGFLALRNRALSSEWQSVMQAAPGCVLIAVLAPKFATGNPADLLALGITLYAATRFSILPVVLIGVCSAAVLRAVLVA